MPLPGETQSSEVDVKLVMEELQPASDSASTKLPTDGTVVNAQSPKRKFVRATRVVTPREEVER